MLSIWVHDVEPARPGWRAKHEKPLRGRLGDRACEAARRGSNARSSGEEITVPGAALPVASGW